MNQLWKKNMDGYQSSAKVVDGNLIISLPDAINPIVWRMELGSVKASALEVKTPENSSTSMLTLKTPKGDVHDIAPFETKEQAVRALMRVSAALQSAEGKFSPAASSAPFSSTAEKTNAPSSANGSGWKWMIALAGVVIVVFMFAYVSSLAPRQADTTTASPTATGTTGEKVEQSGVPESADQLLRGF